MTNDVPGPATPGSGQPPEEGTPAGGWPAELVPPPAAPGAPPPAAAPAQEAPAAPAAPAATPASSGTWGTPPSSGTWGTPGQAPAPQPVPPDAAPTQVWGTPATPAEPAPTTTWGTPPAAAPAPQPQAPAPTTWGAPPAGAPAAVPTPAPAPAPAAPQQPQTWGAATPPPAGGWGAPPAGGQPPAQPVGQPGQWGAPPAQTGWAGGPGAPGGPPPGNWAPAPAKSDNGCLKACLIVGGILLVLGIIGVIAFVLFIRGVADSVGINEDGSFKQCQYISDGDIDSALGQDVTATPVKGFLGDIIAAAVDERILKDADSCWILPTGSNTGLFGRIAVQEDGNAGSTFASIKSTGAGEYTGPDVPGLGDEAFCTGVSDGAGTGVLVRRGSKLVFVSLVDPRTFTDMGTTDDGVVYSAATCKMAQDVARRIAR